jgi:hypothetical protein
VGLSAEQKGKVYKVQEEYNAKVDELEKQIDKLEVERKQKLFEILTDGQKDQLRKIYLDKLGVDPFAPPKKQIEPKKNQ